jgi:hypothetical protein
MNLEKMKQLALLASELRRDGVIGISAEGKRFHVMPDELIGFENLEIKVRGDFNSDYPYEVFHKAEGFTIFCLVTKSNIKDFPQFKEFHKAELLKQLAELEGGQANEQSTNAV